MITPARVQEISDPIEAVYEHIVDELLVNIGKHITAPTWTHTAAWEVQKLAELGQLTQENAEIINRWIKQIPADVRKAMEETRRAALDRLEKQLEAAAADGAIPQPVRDSTVEVLTQYADQAAEKLNLVNTTMLQSSVEQYQEAIQQTMLIQERLDATQDVLNAAAGQVITGAQTRPQAVREALKKISAQGLTGFYDRAGRGWSPEAYVNMVTRTTVHNAAIQATRARMADFNTQVFQVSSHAGARPLCYPYQGKFYSWNNTAGQVELGDGSVVSYEPLNSTSYGQAAGLFGINCGHYPIPVVPGVTIPHGADNIQSEEENAKAYAESQEQRRLERDIREAKRVVEMSGDLATPADRQAIKDAQAEMRDFIARTGRTRRYDRERIGASVNNAVQPQAVSDTIQRESGAAPFSSGSQIDSFFAKESAQLVENTAVGKAFNFWSDGGYGAINNMLRGRLDAVIPADIEEADKDIPLMRDWIAQQTLSEPIVVYRTMPADTFGKARRGIVYSDRGFTAAAGTFEAVEGGVGDRDSVWLELEIPAGQGRGAYIDPVSEFSGAEFEYLIHDNAQFIITGDRVDEEGRLIYTGRLVE